MGVLSYSALLLSPNTDSKVGRSVDANAAAGSIAFASSQYGATPPLFRDWQSPEVDVEAAKPKPWISEMGPSATAEEQMAWHFEDSDEEEDITNSESLIIDHGKASLDAGVGVLWQTPKRKRCVDLTAEVVDNGPCRRGFAQTNTFRPPRVTTPGTTKSAGMFCFLLVFKD